MTYNVTTIQPDPWGWISLTYCRTCGAAVISQELHDEWHKRISQTALDADYAAMMFRPIGGK